VSEPKIQIKQDGRILADGEEIGNVMKVEATGWSRRAQWRAEIGNPGSPEGFRAVYAATRKAAVRAALEK